MNYAHRCLHPTGSRRHVRCAWALSVMQNGALSKAVAQDSGEPRSPFPSTTPRRPGRRRTMAFSQNWSRRCRANCNGVLQGGPRTLQFREGLLRNSTYRCSADDCIDFSLTPTSQRLRRTVVAYRGQSPRAKRPLRRMSLENMSARAVADQVSAPELKILAITVLTSIDDEALWEMGYRLSAKDPRPHRKRPVTQDPTASSLRQTMS